jgi:FkbM family methyltransferase
MAAWHTFRSFDPSSVKVLVDIGAHDGLYSRYAAEYFSLERTILIEPLPEKAEVLSTLKLPGKEVIVAALADRVGTAQFTINATQQASSIKRINTNLGIEYGLDFTEKNAITVELTTLDEVFDSLNLERVDLVKVDVQGAERELLLGAPRSLPRIHFLQIELLFADHYADAADFCELYQMLQTVGFHLARLKDFSHGTTGTLLQCDGVFVNGSW